MQEQHFGFVSFLQMWLHNVYLEKNVMQNLLAKVIKTAFSELELHSVVSTLQSVITRRAKSQKTQEVNWKWYFMEI